MTNRISAQIIADSKNEQGDRITTYVLTFPRIVLAEFNTHRMISKNSASSRAIPFKTMLQKVQDEPFIPIGFQKEHKGMQGSDYFTEADQIEVGSGDVKGHVSALLQVDNAWNIARKEAMNSAKRLSDLGVTKQLCNRILEPFLYHTVICTGTEWENFFALRAHGAAEIHIADLAEKMLLAYNESTPKLLKAREWHIPFGDTFDTDRLYATVKGLDTSVIWKDQEFGPEYRAKFVELDKVKIATARCARVSYLNFEGKDDYAADLKLHDILSSSGHWSPFEHCARAMSIEEYANNISGKHTGGSELHFNSEHQGWSGNFKGFIQYRKTFTGENKTDPRVIAK